MSELVGRTLATAPTGEPITRDECKTFARIDSTAEDSLIDSLLVAARELAEEYCDRQIMLATYDLTYDAFPGAGFIEIPFAPTASITSVKYIDADGAQQTVPGADYVADVDVDPARIYLAYNATWPTVRAQRHAVTVRAVVGYADADAVPDAIKTALKMIVTAWLNDREGCGAMPDGARRILDRYRFRYGA